MYEVLAERGKDVLLRVGESLKIVKGSKVIDVRVGVDSLMARGYWVKPSQETIVRDFEPILKSYKGYSSVLKFNKCHMPEGSSAGGRFCSANDGNGSDLGGSSSSAPKSVGIEGSAWDTIADIIDSDHLFEPNELLLPKDVTQPVATQAEIYRAGGVALEQFWEISDRGHGVSVEIGARVMKKPPEDVTDEEWDTPGPMLFVAPLKGETSAVPKVNKEYKGQWNKLLDIVRGTIAVDHLSDADGVIDKLREKGLVLARQPKNRWETGSPVGYRDILLNFKTPNGMIVEMQINHKEMMRAKNDGHLFYEAQRDIERKYGDDIHKDKWSLVDKAEYKRVIREQQKLYNAAWLKIVEEEEKLKGIKKMEGFSKVFKGKGTETKGKYRYFDGDNALFRAPNDGDEFPLASDVWVSSEKVWVEFTGNRSKPVLFGSEVPENEVNKDWPGAV